MSSFGRGVILGFLALFLAIQIYRPAHPNPPVDAARTLEAAVRCRTPAVEQVLARSCNDCHSDLTHWPWYSDVAPVSWIVSQHVTNGRRHLNFSEWLRDDVNDPAEYTRQKLVSACRELRLGRMPLFSYELLHPKARLSPAEIEAFCNWSIAAAVVPVGEFDPVSGTKESVCSRCVNQFRRYNLRNRPRTRRAYFCVHLLTPVNLLSTRGLR